MDGARGGSTVSWAMRRVAWRAAARCCNVECNSRHKTVKRRRRRRRRRPVRVVSVQRARGTGTSQEDMRGCISQLSSSFFSSFLYACPPGSLLATIPSILRLAIAFTHLELASYTARSLSSQSSSRIAPRGDKVRQARIVSVHLHKIKETFNRNNLLHFKD